MHQRVQCLVVCVNIFPAPKAMASSHHPTGATTSLSTSQSKRVFVCAVRINVLVDRLMHTSVMGSVCALMSVGRLDMQWHDLALLSL